jgi:hypothetical protein
MKRLLTAPAAAIAVMLALGAGGAKAAAIPPSSVAWNYNFSPGAPAITADGNSSAGVTFTNEPTKVAVGSSDLVASNLRVFSSATSAAPDVLTSGGAYSLNLQLSLNDNGTPITKTLTFTGKLSGTLSAESVNLVNKFGPHKKQSVDLGQYHFTVELIAATMPGPPDQTNAGSIAAHVTVSAGSGGGGDPQPAQLPEPSTMLLSSLGLSFLGGAAWRKRRAKVAGA